MTTPIDNPLLASDGLPRFDLITTDHVVPAIQTLLPALLSELEALEGSDAESWDEVIGTLERIQGRFDFAWGTVRHLHRVKNSPALRQAYDAVQKDVVAFDLRLRQSRAVFDKLKALRVSMATPTPAQSRTLDALIKSAEHAGIGLDGAAKERFNAIATELAELGTRFSNAMMDAARSWSMLLTTHEEVEGLPATSLELAAQNARAAGHEGATAESGPWQITLAASDYFPFMTWSARRDLREHIYRASRRRGGEPEFDNRPRIERILALRREAADLLGFATWADLSLDAKMAPDVETVEALLRDLDEAARPVAERELEELRAFAAESGAPEGEGLMPWDVMAWSERCKKARLDFDSEVVRQYFPFEAVLDGMFALSEQLFGVRIEAADGQTSTWHEDVRFFRIVDPASGDVIASFYVDPYSRPAEKLSGAWHGTCAGRSRLFVPAGQAERLPVSYLVCNQTPPTESRPSLMTHGEVRTLFHEFGHGLHHMLTRVDEGFVAGGRNVEWDFIEVPSKFMENWVFQPRTLARISRHVETGEPLPDALIAKIRQGRTWMTGHFVHMQVYLSVLDLELHHRYVPGGEESAQASFERIRDVYGLVPPVEEDYFLCSFAHIFAGGYAAGYYSYKWSEVLSADAFGAFEEAGLDDEAALAEVGRRYRETILALGASEEPGAIFRAFVGREPSVAAFLRHNGLERAA